MKKNGTKIERNTKETIPTEDKEQTLFASWLTFKGILFYAIPNGGSRNVLEAFKLKRTGTKAGVPDICIVVPTKRYHGLYIEMKRRKKSTFSDAQKYWLSALKEKGYCAEVAYGFDDAKSIVERYINDV